MTTFNVGDTVQLNSGGPVLTVVEARPPTPVGVTPPVKVAWIADDGTAREAFFPAACLMPRTPLSPMGTITRPDPKSAWPAGSPTWPAPPINFTVSIGDSDNV